MTEEEGAAWVVCRDCGGDMFQHYIVSNIVCWCNTEQYLEERKRVDALKGE